MTDTLRAMRVVEAIGHSGSLEAACAALTTTALFREAFDSVAMVTMNDASQLEILARDDRHGVFSDESSLSLVASRDLAHALTLPHASTINDFGNGTEAADLWVLPLRSGPRFVGALLGWSRAPLSAQRVPDSAQTVVSAAIKSVLRAHRPPRVGSAMITRRQAG